MIPSTSSAGASAAVLDSAIFHLRLEAALLTVALVAVMVLMAILLADRIRRWQDESPSLVELLKEKRR